MAGFAATTGRAQEPSLTKSYPTRVVKIVLPVLPGSTTDILARLVADELSRKWGKPVVVENMPGAAMNIGSEYVAKADPDGYTLLICPPSPLSINKLLYHDPCQDSERSGGATESSSKHNFRASRLRQSQSWQA
jgi:tripartite-type tricarboxylate transporter receptor subunit TctC